MKKRMDKIRHWIGRWWFLVCAGATLYESIYVRIAKPPLSLYREISSIKIWIAIILLWMHMDSRFWTQLFDAIDKTEEKDNEDNRD